MKTFALIFGLLMPLAVLGQAQAKTQPMSFNMDAASMPSNINYVDGSLRLGDADSDKTIGANEQCEISFQIVNIGDGDGSGCEARIKVIGTADGITCMPVKLPKINKGDTLTIRFPLVTNHHTKNGTAKFTMEIYEPNGLGTGELTMNVPTHQFDAPNVEVGQYVVQSDKTELKRKELFVLQVPVQNLAQGTAENVKVSIKVPSGITLLSNNNIVEIPQLKPNEARVISYDRECARTATF